jgi:2-polyprenyl-6-methoxyphenol hydroxylase-like FAD-dependent oxidoreductase
MSSKADVLVVGAGPTGLIAAVELARRGVAVRIIDGKEGPEPLSKAVGVSPHSLEILEASGVTERLLAAGIRIRGAELRFGERKLGAFHFSVLRHRFDFLLSLPQSDTETIMADVLASLGVSIEWRTRLVNLKASPNQAEAVIEQNGAHSSENYSCVFGADGVDSTVRRCLGLPFKGYTHRRQWSIADTEMERWPYEHDTAHLFLHPGGDVGFIIPIGPNRFRAVSNTPDAMARVPGAYLVARLLRTDVFHIPARQTETYQRDCVFLAGDAAHAHSPVGARGMNLGIEDAAAFARRFAERSLDGYTSERHPPARRWIELSERILRFVQATNPLVVSARNLTLGLASRVPALQRTALERVAGLRE